MLDTASSIHISRCGASIRCSGVEVHQMAADALSDVLKTVRLTGAAYFDVAAKTPWVAESPRRDLILPKILPGAGHLIAYHCSRRDVASPTSLGRSRLRSKRAK
jgi:hypothetical protein